MTDTHVDICFQRASSELRVNETLTDVLYEAFGEVGRPLPDAKSEALARDLYATLPVEALGVTERKAKILYGDEGRKAAEAFRDEVLLTNLYPRHVTGMTYWASTDVGDVSFCKPLGFLHVSCLVKDVPLHTWQAVAFGKSSFAMEGMLTAAKVIGAAGIRLCEEPLLALKAKQEWEEQNRLEPYVCPLPEEAKPEGTVQK